MFFLRFSGSNCEYSHPSCLLCKPSGCVKCTSLIVFPSRDCVSECPSGYRVRWSTLVDYMGKMCVHTGYFGGLSGETAAVVVGICSGAVICFVIIISGVFYVRFKRKHPPSSVPSENPSDVEDSPERRDFLKQLETLRPHADTFLDMLNDTRKQIRDLHGAGDNAAITAYKPVVRDLAKILLLLNRSVDKLVIPDDWDHLFSWAEKTLKRYKRMSEVSQPQVAQLVTFLQTPIRSSGSVDSPTYSQTMSTFKPDQGSVLSLQDVAVKNFNSNYDSMLNPQWNFNYSLVNSSPVSPNCNVESWQENNTRDFLNSSYLLEDDFFQFGFRPQDEITTEL